MKLAREGSHPSDREPADRFKGTFAPRETHWDGATPSTAMTHIAIQETVEDQAVVWLAHVSGGEYGRSHLTGQGEQ